MNAQLNTPKQLLKSALVQLAARFGRHRKQKPAEPQLVILMYHRVLPADDPRAQLEEPGMMVTPQSFRLHMQTLREFFTPIQLSEWLQIRAEGGKLPAKACAITFDDGWLDNYEFAWPILRELEIPASIFLVAEMTGGREHFWPLRLAHICQAIATTCPESWQHPSVAWLRQAKTTYSFSQQAPDQHQLSEIIAAAKDLSDSEVHQRLDTIEQALELKLADKPSLLDWRQVKEMLQSGLIEAGSHTCRHTRLTDDCLDEVLQHEIIDSKHLIEQHTGEIIKIFCYPNGDISEGAAALVKQHYLGAVTTQAGWNSAQSDSHRLKRIGIHEDISYNRNRFLACLSGWF